MIDIKGSILKRSLTKREIKLIIALVVSLVLLGIYSILNPRIKTILSLKSKLNDIENQRASIQKLYKSSTDMGFLSKYNELIKRIPKDNGVSEFLIDIENLAEERDLIIISIYPCNEFGNDDNLISFSIVVNGDYESLSRFVSDIENFTRSLHINRVELNRINHSADKLSSSWELVVDIDLVYLPTKS